MKHRSIVLVTILLVLLLSPGFPARLAVAAVQSDKEAQEEPPPDEPQEEEELVPDEPEEEPEEEPAAQEQPPPSTPAQAPQQLPPPVPPPAQTPLLVPPPPQQAAPNVQTPLPTQQTPVTVPSAPSTVPVQQVPPPTAPAPTTAPHTVPPTAAPVAPPTAAPGSEKAAAAPVPTKLPSSLAKTQQRLVTSPLAQDPTAVALLAAVQSEKATARDFNDLAVYLARKNLFKDAEGYAEMAVKMETNRDYWLNYGTIRLQVGTLSSALTAYKKARDLDPNHGFTWYSIGVVYDYMRSYDKAVEAYTMALNLDPSLGDSRKNPQVVNNGRLMVVNLLLYKEREGGLVMPLVGGPPVEKPPAPSRTRKTSEKP